MFFSLLVRKDDAVVAVPEMKSEKTEGAQFLKATDKNKRGGKHNKQRVRREVKMCLWTET